MCHGKTHYFWPCSAIFCMFTRGENPCEPVEVVCDEGQTNKNRDIAHWTIGLMYHSFLGNEITVCFVSLEPVLLLLVMGTGKVDW